MAAERALAMLLVGAMCILFVVLAPILSRYGGTILLSPEYKRLQLTEEDAQALRHSHRFVLMGGSHRGGTTLLWRLLTRQPDTSGFNEYADTDFGEGAFLQTVLPTFGVGSELTSAGRSVLSGTQGGLGRYAFSPDAHLTELHPLNSAVNSRKLLSEWGFHWNLTRPVLLEKTPTNMITSRLLQSLLGPSVNFLFITRHPLAVSLAHRRWQCCALMSLPSLLLHWVASHRILATDLPHLQAARVLRYEDLVRRPRQCLTSVLRWLKLPAPAVAAAPAANVGELEVTPDTNRKYETEYCARHLTTPLQQRDHCAMAWVLQPELDTLQLGYDLMHGNRQLGFKCIRHRLRNGTCGGVPPSSHVMNAFNQLKLGESRAAPLGGAEHCSQTRQCVCGLQ